MIDKMIFAFLLGITYQSIGVMVLLWVDKVWKDSFARMTGGGPISVMSALILWPIAAIFSVINHYLMRDGKMGAYKTIR